MPASPIRPGFGIFAAFSAVAACCSVCSRDVRLEIVTTDDGASASNLVENATYLTDSDKSPQAGIIHTTLPISDLQKGSWLPLFNFSTTPYVDQYPTTVEALQSGAAEGIHNI